MGAYNSMPNGAKRWCFTVNNPTFDDVQLLVGTDADGPQANYGAIQYIVFQEERGAEGTLHWQGFLILKERKTIEWLKRNINPRAHWEVARETNEKCANYCMKSDTYTGGLRVERGEMPTHPKAGTKEERLEKAAEELDEIKEGYKRPAEIPSMTLMQCGFIPAYKELTADVLGPYRPDLKIITMVGRPGTGKSYSINYLFPTHGRCIYGNNGVWFQNPCADIMVFEEFNGQIPLQRMLQLLDPYPNALEVKGGMRPALYHLVIITSNTRPDGWYKGEQAGEPGKRTDAILALWDRIGFSNGCYIPVRNCGHYLEPHHSMEVEDCRNWFLKGICQICNIPEPIEDSSNDGSDVEHEDLPDDPPSDSDDEQENRRKIGY